MLFGRASYTPLRYCSCHWELPFEISGKAATLRRSVNSNLNTYTLGGIHPARVDLASPRERPGYVSWVLSTPMSPFPLSPHLMAADGIPPKLLRLIKAYYSSTKIKVRASGSDPMLFEIHSGVRQECTLSPTLFNYIIDWSLGQGLHVMWRIQTNSPICAPSQRLTTNSLH